MTSLNLTDRNIEGFEAIDVTNGILGLTLIPGLGGKISSLRDLRSGREWLWRHPRMPYQRVPHGSSYVQTADTGGWDECFPSVSACDYPAAPWSGAAIQDHGELWSQVAELEVQPAGDHVTLRTRWKGVVLPYRFERAVTLAEGAEHIRVEYMATNESDSAMPFIWCIHPLLAIEPGMQLLLPPEASYNLGGVAPRGMLERGQPLRYPLTVRSDNGPIDLTALPDPTAAIALKLWSDPLRRGWATLRASNGELRMRWDIARLPQVALWMNLGAWSADGGSPYFNLGLEPCIGAQDSLAEAVTEYKQFRTLPPLGTYSWGLEIELAA